MRMLSTDDMHELSFVVTPNPDHTVQVGVVEPATIRVASRPIFPSMPALERALHRVGLPRSIAGATGGSEPLPVTLVQLSRLGFL